MKKLIVEHQRGKYTVFINRGIIDTAEQLIKKITGDNPVFFVIDQNVLRLYNRKLKALLSAFGSGNYFIIPQGESSKSYRFLKNIHAVLLKERYSRESFIVSIGGGVTGDLAGFAASTYLRGIRLIHIPTTIIAAADSSIGGKTGINFNQLKNVIGSFHQPEMVLIDTNFFDTLSDETYLAGTGELVKYAYLAGPKVYTEMLHNSDRLMARDPAYLEKILNLGIKLKAAVVKQDERETGVRKILNFGHTFAHGYESASGLSIPHGVAVSAGIVSALILSNKCGLLKNSDLQYLLKLPLKISLPNNLFQLIPEKVYNYMLNDKKNTSKDINFILLKEPGELLIDFKAPKDLTLLAIRESLKFFREGRKLSGFET